MIRLSFLLSIALYCTTASAQAPMNVLPDPGVVIVKLPGPDTLQTGAGETVGFGLRLQQSSGIERTLRLEIDPPEGWSGLLAQRPFVLLRDSTAMQLVSLLVPRDARAGVYDVVVRLRASDGWVRTMVRRVRVAARTRISLDILDAPLHVIAGESFEASVLVTNSGNASNTVRVSARSLAGATVDPAESNLNLEPGTSATVRLQVRTAPQTHASSDRLMVAAIGADRTQSETSLAIWIVPRTDGADGAQRWPLRASLSAVSYGEAITPLVGAEGEVALDQNDKHRLTLRAEGLGAVSQSIFAPPPEAWVRYVGPDVEAMAGTGSYVLSPATTSSVYGIGAMVRGQIGRWDASVLFREPMPYRGTSTYVRLEEGSHTGLSLGLQAAPWAHVGVNVLTGTGPADGGVVTSRVQVGSAQALSLDAEGGLELSRKRPVYGVRATFESGRAGASAETRHREATQPGRLTSLTTQTITARYNVTGAVSVHAMWRGLHVEDGRDTLVVPYADRGGNATLRWSRSSGRIGVRAEVGTRHQRYFRGVDALQPLDRSATLAIGSAGLSWDSFRATVRVAGGQTVHHEDDTRHSAWEAALDVGASAGRANVSVNLGLSEGTSLWETRPSREWNAGINATAPVARGVRLDAAVSTGHFEAAPIEAIAVFRSRTATARFGAVVSLPGGSEISFGGHAYKTGPLRALHLASTLRVPIRMPLPYSVDRPRVQGRFVDHAGGDGIAGVLLIFGESRVVTGTDGSFVFDAVPAGGYLFLDRSTLKGRVPTVAFPLFAKPGEPLIIEAARGASVRGSLRQMRVLGTGASADTLDAAGVTRAVIEATGLGQRFRAITDTDGRFAFEDLAVGSYTLRVVRATLPAGYRLEQETIGVDAVGDTEVMWRVLPAARQLRLLGGASHRLGTPNEERVADAETTSATQGIGYQASTSEWQTDEPADDVGAGTKKQPRR